MDSKKALEILVQSVTIANKRGAFELAESKIIAEAVEVFMKKEDGGTDTTKEEENKEVSSEESAG